ncbi:uncharacterized protein LOC144887576 isoform X2 [Branchiostoma floridae x Branchiostoma japonicum]
MTSERSIALCSSFAAEVSSILQTSRNVTIKSYQETTDIYFMKGMARAYAGEATEEAFTMESEEGTDLYIPGGWDGHEHDNDNKNHANQMYGQSVENPCKKSKCCRLTCSAENAMDSNHMYGENHGNTDSIETPWKHHLKCTQDASAENILDSNPCYKSTCCRMTCPAENALDFNRMYGKEHGNTDYLKGSQVLSQDASAENILDSNPIYGNSSIQPPADDDLFTKPYVEDTLQYTGDSFSIQPDADSHPDIQPYAVRNQEDDDNGNGSQMPATYGTATNENMKTASKKSGPIQTYDDSDPNIQPYAVRNQEDDDDDDNESHMPTKHSTAANKNMQTASKKSDVDGEDIQPNAVRYQIDEDDATSRDSTTGNGPNTGWRYRLPWVAGVITVILVLISLGILVGVLLHTGTSKQTRAANSTRTPVHHVNSSAGSTTADRMVVYTIPSPDYPFLDTTPTLPTASDWSEPQVAENYEKELGKITFGGYGTETGKFRSNFGVAVSNENEIFVTDWYNQRIQVFGMDGDLRRIFPTNVAEDDTAKILPTDVTLDGNGFLWAVGQKEPLTTEASVVQYRKDGLPVTKFDITLKSSQARAKIAVDISNGNIIVGENNEIMIFQPNGSLFIRFSERILKIGGIALDGKGNILVTDSLSNINVYNQTGHSMLKIRTYEYGKRENFIPCGICMDTKGKGHILVADCKNGGVEMFTVRGEFVRTIVKETLPNAKSPVAIALGPGGQLVVTIKDTVTVFSSQVLKP